MEIVSIAPISLCVHFAPALTKWKGILMRVILFLFAALAVLASIAVFSQSQSAVHEIEGFVLLLTASVLLAGAATVEAVRLAGERIERKLDELNKR